jgi:ornithine cyclodeaminase/alanine dehydrogenase
LLYITGLLTLNCPETGVPLAVMDGTWITEKSTAGATAIGVRKLAAPGARRLGIIGAGMQDRANTDALRRVSAGLTTVAVFDPSQQAREIFEREILGYRLKVEQAESAEGAVVNSDIVVTCTPIVQKPQPVIPSEWLKPASAAVSVDFDATIKPDTAHAVDGMWVDDAKQFEYYRRHGHLANMPAVYEELMRLVSGEAGCRREDDRHFGFQPWSGFGGYGDRYNDLSARARTGSGNVTPLLTRENHGKEGYKRALMDCPAMSFHLP